MYSVQPDGQEEKRNKEGENKRGPIPKGHHARSVLWQL